MNLNWRASNQLNSNMTVEYQTGSKYQISNFLSWRRDDYNLTFATSYSNNNHWQLSLGINFALDYDYHNQLFNLKNTYSPATGTLDLFTFIDNNKNALYDEYDEELENVKFGSYPYWNNTSTNKHGTAYLPGTAANSPVKVYFNTENTQAPQLKAIHENFKFYTHPGGIISLDIPFNYATVVEGIIALTEKSVSAKFIPMQILNSKNQVIQQVTADIDNEYYFSKVWPGKYKLRIDPEYLNKKDLQSNPIFIPLKLNGDEEFLKVTEFNISPETKKSVKSSITHITAVKALTEVTQPLVNSYKSKITNYIHKAKLKTASILPSNSQNIYTVKNTVFSIQVGAYSDLKYCISKINELSQLNLSDIFSKQVNNFCKIYMGQYTDETTARVAIRNLPKSIKKGGFIVRLQF